MILAPKKISQEEHTQNYENKKTLFNMPFEVKFCKKCVISNQRPNSEVEYTHTPRTKKIFIKFNNNNICQACEVAEEKKKQINWDSRHEELEKYCNEHRSKNGYYDCLVPGSGGKDSFFASHVLKYKYKMNPLTITWAPHMYTQWGIKNMENWVNAGFDNYLITPNRKVQRLLTRIALENLFHPFQPFMFGQKMLAPKLAKKLGINLIFYGENNAEYGNDAEDLKSNIMNDKFFSVERYDEDNIFIGGLSLRELKNNFKLTDNDLSNYLPILKKDFNNSNIQVHFLSHYIKWHPQSNYYYAVKYGNFITSPERMPGTYTKYSSIDDKMEDFNYYTLGIKYGLGWTSYIASFEVRDGDLTRDEAVALVKKYDLEFPKRFSNDFYEYLTVKKNELPEAYKQFEKPEFDHNYFIDLHDKFRSPHLWGLNNQHEWELRETVWKDREKNNYFESRKMKQEINWKGNKKEVF